MRRLSITLMCLLLMVVPVVAQDGPSLPPNLEPITAENVGRVEQLAAVGGGYEWPARWSEDGQIVYLITFDGILAFPINDLAHPYLPDTGWMVDPSGDQPEIGTVDDPIATSLDGQFIVHHEHIDEQHALLHIIDSQTQQEIKTIAASSSAWPRTISLYRFMPQFFTDGLLFVRDNILYRWNPANDMETLLFSARGSDIFFSPDGRYAATAERMPSVSLTCTFRIWDLSTSPATLLLTRIKPPSDNWNSVVFSPDGHHVATGGNGANVRVWDLSEPGLPYRDDGKPNESGETSVVDLAYSPDGRYLAGTVSTIMGGLGFLRDATTGEELATIRDDTRGSYIWDSHWNSVAFHPTENVLVFTTWDGGVWLWDIDTLISAGHTDVSTAMCHLSGHTDAVLDINFSPDGSQLVTASFDQTVRLWDYRTGETIRKLESDSLVETAVFNSQGNRIAINAGGTIHLWDQQTGDDQIAAMAGIRNLVFSPVMSGEREVLIGVLSGDLILLTLDPQGLESFRVVGANPDVYTASGAISPDGRMFVAAGITSVLQVWGVPAE